MVHVDELNCAARMAPECVFSEFLCFSGGCLLELTVFSGGKKKKKKAEALCALGFSILRSCTNALIHPSCSLLWLLN